MTNLFEFTENELKEVDKLKAHYKVETRGQAIRCAIKEAMTLLGYQKQLASLLESRG